MFKFYEVGGKVRDELLGLTNKDIDYVAVPCEEALKENLTTCDMFQLLWEHLIAEKFEIFLVTPDCYTIRAYGSQGWKGWGGEIYFKKYGEIMMDVVDKKKARREAKKHIENELQDQL